MFKAFSVLYIIFKYIKKINYYIYTIILYTINFKVD